MNPKLIALLLSGIGMLLSLIGLVMSLYLKYKV